VGGGRDTTTGNVLVNKHRAFVKENKELETQVSA
jgi:hypothetical protein